MLTPSARPAPISRSADLWGPRWKRESNVPFEDGQIEPETSTRSRKQVPLNCWRIRHDEHSRENGNAVACAAPCRPTRFDPRAWRPREQPQGHQHRDPEAPADGVHRRLRLGQELAGVQHDRRGVAAADQRDLQRLRAGLHADAGPARGRRARRADDRDHRRPGADGRRCPLHGRHRHRRQRDAADAVQPARGAADRAADCLLVQCPGAESERSAERRQGQGRARSWCATPSTTAACVRAAKAGARSPISTSPRSTTTPSRSPRARSLSPAGSRTTSGRCGSTPSRASSTRTSRSATTPRRS